MGDVDSRQETIEDVSKQRRRSRRDIATRSFEYIGHLFDTIAIEYFDDLPDAVTVTIFVVLLAILHASIILMLWLLFSANYLWATTAAVAVTSVIAGTPIVGFGQMQYRRVRSSYLASEALMKQLTVAHDEALRANAEKSRFLASMSHELRTPLNAIIGFSEILKEQTLGPLGFSKYAEYANDIHKSGIHLLDLINDVLDLSKIESGHMPVNNDMDVVIQSEIEDCCGLLGVLAEKNGVKLIAEMMASPRGLEPIRVSVNGRMIRQILLNLISNAIKFTPENGTVIVRTYLDSGEGAIIEVSDTGVGMTKQEIAVALKPFGQVDCHLSRKCEGTGLGLPLAKAMIELHGGCLAVHSVPGRGTTFSFNIPRTRGIFPSAWQAKVA